jgi:hypothetical protein
VKRTGALIIFIFSLAQLHAQHTAAYFDYKNYFVVFDDGAYKELEYTPVTSYKNGGDFVAYINMDSSLKFYYKGNTYTLEESKPQSFACSENFCVYKMNRRLMKVEDGDKRTLCEWATDYKVGDSIVAFVDYGDPAFRAYYDGQVYPLETGVNEGGVREYKVSQNLVAYVDASNALKVFWHGRTFDMNAKKFSLSYAVGTDMVAFVDNFTNEFKVFYKGEIITLDQTPPLSFQVNLNSVAYVDNAGNFNIFYNGETQFISAFQPETYYAAGNIIQFVLKGQWKVFFKGKIIMLESNLPNLSNLKLNNINWSTSSARNTLPYLDGMGRLKLFDNGEVRSNISYELATKLEDVNDIIIYVTGINTTNIYYKGKTY